MIEFYPEIKWLHIATVIASGLLFVLRGAGVQAQAAWPMHAAVRYASYSIDTILLTAGVMLATILPGALFANGWLMMKIGLLIVYIGLGSFALKRGRTRNQRLLFLSSAVLVYLVIIAIARAHHPLGPLHILSA